MASFSSLSFDRSFVPDDVTAPYFFTITDYDLIEWAKGRVESIAQKYKAKKYN
jgi:hypothetical protein